MGVDGAGGVFLRNLVKVVDRGAVVCHTVCMRQQFFFYFGFWFSPCECALG